MKIKTILFIFIFLLLIVNVSAVSITYNFNSTYENVNMFAQSCQGNGGYGGQLPNNTIPPQCRSVPTIVTASTTLNAIDDSQLQSSNLNGPTWNMFSAKINNISIADITLLNWTHTWKSVLDQEQNYYIYNNSISNWSIIGSAQLDQTQENQSFTIINASKYTNSSNYTFFLVYANLTSNVYYVRTDFVKLEITYNGLIINSLNSNQEILNSLSTTLNTSQLGYNNTIWYTWNKGIKNYTLCTNSNECKGTITFPRQGYYNLTVYGNKSDGTITSKSVNNLFISNYTYQETANVSVGSGTFNTGNYVSTGAWGTASNTKATNFYDEDWTTGSFCTSGTCYHYINYTKPLGDTLKSLWQILVQPINHVITNLSIPSICWNANPLIISFSVTTVESTSSDFMCFNGTHYQSIIKYSDHSTDMQPREESMNWFYYNLNIAPTITNILSNNSNFSISNVNFTFNISDDNDYIKNASIYTAKNYGNELSKTYLPNSLNSRAYSGTASVKPPTTINLNNENNLLIGDLNTISVQDGVNFSTIVTDSTYSGLRINFKIIENVSIINNITITAIGNAYGSSSDADFRSNFSLYIWNSSSWEHLNSINDSCYNDNCHPLLNLNSTITNVSKYINQNNLSILLMGEIGDLIYANTLLLDYAKIDLVYNASSFTRNATIFNQPINTSINNTFNISIAGFEDGTTYWYSEVCDSDNICNQSSVFQFLIDTTPPTITIISPISKTYISDIIDINVSLNEEGSWCGYSLNGAPNVTMTKFNNTYFNVSGYDFNNGAHIINFSCNDTFNNFGFNTINFAVDTIPPVITLNYPQTLTYISNNTFYFNYTPYSPIGLGTCELWGNWTGIWHLNQSNWTTTNNTINQFKPTIIANGLYKWNIWCNSSIGTTEDWSPQGNQTFIVDTIYPDLNLTSPLNKTYTNNSINLNYTRNDTYLNTCWYTDDGGYTTNFLSNCNNITYSANQGSTAIILYANDSAGNTNSSNVTFFVDSILPSILISVSFSNNSYLNYNTSIIINATITDANRQSCWYNDNRGSNITFTCGNNLSLDLNESLHTIYIYANDTLNNQNFDSISFTPDVTYPQINITTPITTTSGSKDITFTHSVSDVNLGFCKYSIINSSGGFDIVNDVESQNRSLTCSEVDKSVTVSSFGTYNLTIWVNDSAGNENSSTESFTTTASSSSSSGGSGGESGVSEMSVVAIKNPINLTKLSNLYRAILYARVREYCLNFSLSKDLCLLSEGNIIELNFKLLEQNIKLTINELEKYLESYNNNELESVKASDSDVSRYDLFTGVLQVIGKGFLINPKRIDTFWLVRSNAFSYISSSNKELKSCEVLKGELGWICNVTETSAKIYFKLEQYPPKWISRNIQSSISYTDVENNVFIQDINIRAINILNKESLAIGSLALLLGTIGFIIWKKRR